MAPYIDTDAVALAALVRGHVNNCVAVLGGAAEPPMLTFRGRPLIEAYVWARGGAELEAPALAALAAVGATPTAEALFLAFVTHASTASLANLLLACANANANVLRDAAPRVVCHLILTGDAEGLRRFFEIGGVLPPAAAMPGGRLLHLALDATPRDAAVERLLIVRGRADQNERDAEWGRTPSERARAAR